MVDVGSEATGGARPPAPPVRELIRPLATIGWGAFIATFVGCGINLDSADGSVRLSVTGLIGTIVVLVGLRGLPVRALSRDLVRLRTMTVAAACASLLLLVALVIPMPQDIVTAGLVVTEWTWRFLTITLVARILALVGGPELAARWRWITRAWVALGVWTAVVAVGVAAVLGSRAAGRPGSLSVERITADEVGWLWLAFGLALVVAYVATCVWIGLVGSRSMDRLRSMAPGPPSEDETRPRAPSEPDDGTTGPNGPRLGRRGDRVIYYVDPQD